MGYQGKTLAAALHNLNLPMQTAVHSGDQCKLRKKNKKPSLQKLQEQKLGGKMHIQSPLEFFMLGETLKVIKSSH